MQTSGIVLSFLAVVTILGLTGIVRHRHAWAWKILGGAAAVLVVRTIAAAYWTLSPTLDAILLVTAGSALLTALWFLRRSVETTAPLPPVDSTLDVWFRQSPAVQLIIDPLNGAVIDANPPACAFYGFAAEKIRLLMFSDLGVAPPGGDAPGLPQEGGRRQLRQRRANGETRDVIAHATPIRLGGQQRLLCVLEDVTEYKRVSEALKTSREFAHGIIESSLDMIVAVDNERRIVEFNRAAQETFGYTFEDVAGKHINILYADAVEGVQVHKVAFESGRCVQEILNRRKNGEVFPCFLSAAVMHDERGNVIGIVGVSRDITRQKRAEKEREELINDLQDALGKVKTLSGLLPICSSCKRIKDEEGSWHQLEGYIREHSDAEFSHGICPDCMRKIRRA